MEIWNLRMELKIGAWNSGRGIFLLNLFRIIGIKMYSMLGLFVYIYICICYIIFWIIWKYEKNVSYGSCLTSCGKLNMIFRFFFFSLYIYWCLKRLECQCKFFFFFFLKWNYVFFNIASFVTLFEEEFDDYFWSIMYRIFL